MAASVGSHAVAYKKKDGSLMMASDGKSITWAPKGSGSGLLPVTIKVADITHLQQTPATSPKVMLKVFAQATTINPSAGPSPNNAPPDATEQYIFSFTSGTNARAEADAIKDALSATIQAIKTGQVPTKESAPAAMAIASALSSAAGKPSWDDDSRLIADVELQQSLLKFDPALQRVFMETLRTKAETVSNAQFVSQFWSTRVHLLRAHAIEKSQTRGSYNVLSTLKPRVEDNVTKLNISKEQIQLIFSQHPLVKKVYDENVPKLTEQQFWSRFFQSRLFKKLRGERVTDADPTDPILDKYLRVDEFAGRSWTANVPHIIDLEGNEENHSQRQGNRPNFDMRPADMDKVPIIRTLNSLSEKIMANVTPVDADPSAPIGLSEEAYNELQLRDLREDEELKRITLNVRDQSLFLTETKPAEDEETRIFARQDPHEVLRRLQNDLDSTFPPKNKGGVRLDRIIEPEETDSDNDDDTRNQQKSTKPRKERVGSRSALAAASTQIFSAIRDRKSQFSSPSATLPETCGLPPVIFDRLTLTHATTTEFLHQFWQAFLSGNPDRAGEIASLVESLNHAMDRIKAVADEAEKERQVEIERLKQHAREVMASTGRNIRPNLKGVEGGGKTVNALLEPTVKALGKALDEYRKALGQAQQVQVQEGTGGPAAGGEG
ncbi:RNA polymerase II transcription factor [Histoplasma capsulatum var. duboisii H88]|uniref:RNA polymerase II transcription factor n=2 Tax=Ajellomyces capsulatus (strain H88) TaxID=544711 RepID=A0A8A1L6S1_AJEC8|nr:RNA polymerase II transcription factor [Histoplasma capsulatum var. duboisii H88]